MPRDCPGYSDESPSKLERLTSAAAEVSLGSGSLFLFFLSWAPRKDPYLPWRCDYTPAKREETHTNFPFPLRI